MVAKKKKLKPINWNLIMFIIAIAALIAVIIPGFNQKRIDNLKDEVDKLKEEKVELQEETDPAWQKKFNEQRKYFENEIGIKEKLISKNDLIIDSLKKLPPAELDTNNITISIKAAKKVLIAAEQGKIYLELLNISNDQISLLEQRVNAKDSIIFYQDKILEYDRQIEQTQKEIIGMYKEIQPSNNRGFLNPVVLICLILILLISLYLFFIPKPKETSDN